MKQQCRMKEGFVEDIYGHALTHAKDRREVADYDIESRISEEEAESIVESKMPRCFWRGLKRQ